MPGVLAQDKLTPTKTNKGYYSGFLNLGLSMQGYSYPKNPSMGITATGFLPTFGVGACYAYPIASWLKIQPRLSYLQKGTAHRSRVFYDSTGVLTIVGGGKEGKKFIHRNKFH